MSEIPVSVPLSALQSGDIPHSTLLSAFGPSSLGILLVTDLPAAFPSLRHKVLSNSSRLAALSPKTLNSLSNPDAKYLVGWSHGKETLRPGVIDTLKGSYYVNCAFYQDPALNGADAAKHPGFEEYTADNIWPPESPAEGVPGFRSAAEELITLIIDTAVLVARACDKFAESEIEGYECGYLEKVVRTSTTTKARLLHYFPSEETNGGKGHGDAEPKANGETDEMDDWCATHLDHGCLTGLTSAMFIDELAHPPNQSSTSPLAELSASPDPLSGLYIRSRANRTVKTAIPRDALAFQTGEALERITRGRFKAVPHFVRGSRPQAGMRVARNTLAVFTQPNLDEVVDAERGWTFGEFARGVVGKNTTKEDGSANETADSG